MKRNLTVLCLLMVVALLLVGCAPAAPAETEAPADAQEPADDTAAEDQQPEAKGGKIAGIVFQEDQYMKLLQMGYKDAVEEGGYEFMPANTNLQQGKEAELINTYCDQKIAGLAITPVSEAASVASMEQAAEAGIIVGVCNSNFVGENENFTATFNPKQYEMGKQTGLAAAEFIKKNNMTGTIKLAIVQFKTLIPEQSLDRVNGFMDQIKDLEGVEIEVVTDQDAWMQDKAITLVTDIITAHPDVNIIYAANEGGAIGATMAVQNSGKAGDIYVFGQDCSDVIVKLLREDTDILQAVCGEDPYVLGYETAKAVVESLDSGKAVGNGELREIPLTTLVRGDEAAIDTFLADLNEKLSRLD